MATIPRFSRRIWVRSSERNFCLQLVYFLFLWFFMKSSLQNCKWRWIVRQNLNDRFTLNLQVRFFLIDTLWLVVLYRPKSKIYIKHSRFENKSTRYHGTLRWTNIYPNWIFFLPNKSLSTNNLWYLEKELMSQDQYRQFELSWNQV